MVRFSVRVLKNREQSFNTSPFGKLSFVPADGLPTPHHFLLGRLFPALPFRSFCRSDSESFWDALGVLYPVALKDPTTLVEESSIERSLANVHKDLLFHWN